jgi:hypothetical protein
VTRDLFSSEVIETFTDSKKRSTYYRILLTLLIIVALDTTVVPTAVAQRSGNHHFRNSKIISSVVQVQRIDKSTGSWGTVGAGVFLKSDTLGTRYYFITARHLYLPYDSINLIYHTYGLTRTGKHVGLRIGSDVLNRNLIPAYVPKTEDSDFVVVPIVPDTSITLGGIAFDECAKFDDLDYGQSVQFYGYPSYDFLGLSVGEYDFPVCRTGHIAYFFVDSIETKYVETGIQRGMFLVDGFSIGGNSGGLCLPLITRPSMMVRN